MRHRQHIMTLAATLTALLLPTAAEAQMQALFGFSTFYLPADDKPYFETYLQVDAWTMDFQQTPEGNYRATVEVSLVLRRDDTIYLSHRYDVNSPTVASLDELDFSFLDMHRFNVDNGIYDIELTLHEKGSASAPSMVSEKLVVNYTERQPTLSSVRFIAEATPTVGEQTIFSRCGYEMEPYVSDYYPEQLEVLNFFYEIYNIDYEVGSRPFLAMAYIEQRETGARVGEQQVVARKQSSQTVPVYGSMDISTLPSGNYNLVVDIRNRDGQTMLIRRTPFFRSNPTVKAVSTVSDFATTWVGKYNDESALDTYLDALDPIASDIERSNIGNLIGRPALQEKQAFLYQFWSVRSTNPEQEWLQYKDRIDYVIANLSYPKTPGTHTDRGRIYLKYGPPDFVRDEKNFVSVRYLGTGTHSSDMARTVVMQQTTGGEPVANASKGHIYYLPYQLWRYDHAEGQDAKVVFIFWDEHRSGYYSLLNSNARGEIQEIGWERRLSRYQLAEGVIGEVGEQFNRGY